MKWLGQSIVDFIARFRSDVYLESISSGTIASGGYLGLDSNNKIVKASETGDIERISFTTDSGAGAAQAKVISGNADFSILGGEGVDVTNTSGGAGSLQLDVVLDLNEVSTSTDSESATEGFIVVVDGEGAQKKMAGSNIPNSIFNNDSGYAAGDITGVTAGTNLTGGGTTGAVTVNLADASTSAKGAASFNSNEFSVSSGAVSLKNAVQRVYGGTTIKVLPSDFMANEDAGATKTVQFSDSGTTGLKPGAATLELWAFVDIPEGKKATHIDVYAQSNHAISAHEIDIDASGISAALGSGLANTQLDITDVDATATNYLGIYVATGGTGNRIYGALVTIADQ